MTEGWFSSRISCGNSTDSSGSKLLLQRPYHLQTDGQTEHVNQELKTFIRMFCNHHQNNWDDLLPAAEFALANHVHASTQVTPFMADTSRNPRMGFEPLVDVVDEGAAAFRTRMEKGLNEAKASLAKAKAEYALYYNQCREPVPRIPARGHGSR